MCLNAESFRIILKFLNVNTLLVKKIFKCIFLFIRAIINKKKSGDFHLHKRRKF